MAAMGLGAYISRFFKSDILFYFVVIELLLGVIGGLSIPALYLAFSYTDFYFWCMLFFIVVVGILTGLEIPFLSRIMQQYKTLDINLSLVLSVDYIGALAATLVFPFLIIPFLGLFKGSLSIGTLNIVVAVCLLIVFKDQLHLNKRRSIMVWISAVIILFSSLFIVADQFLSFWNNSLYDDRIVYSTRTPYQHIVLTQNKDDYRLFLNGNLQFSSIDEYRYHEALVHVPLHLNKQAKDILLLGGGDGLAVRELLKYPSIRSITVVDIDPAITTLAKENNHLKILNKQSLLHDSVRIVNEDAMLFLKHSNATYDHIILDLPDPNNVSLARLYSYEFYRLLKRHMNENAVLTTQATSPFFAKQTFWCIEKTLQDAGFSYTIPYHIHVPSFGDWGFIAATNKQPKFEPLSVSTQYLDQETLANALYFPKDIVVDTIRNSTLDDPRVLRYYLSEWKYWN